MSGMLIPVLLYHSVSDDHSSWGSVPQREFAAHIDAIAASGRAAVTVTALAGALRGDLALPGRVVAITFDDGYADTYDAVELLRNRGLGATVYITTGAIGKTARLAKRQVSELARTPGVEVGAHAVRHVHLDELRPGELEAEIRVSKAQLEEMSGVPVESFAYPHGAYDRRVRGSVIAAGYQSAAGVKNAISHLGDDPFAVARWTVRAGTPAARIADVLDGHNVALAWQSERLRTRAYRAARWARWRLIRWRSGLR